VTANTYTGGTITALTDATGCPGVLCGKNSEAAGLLNCCVTGTTNCNGTCTTNSTYTYNTSNCSGTCHQAYVELRNQCGETVNPSYGTYELASCKAGCDTKDCAGCAKTCAKDGWTYAQMWTGECRCKAENCTGMTSTPWHSYVYTDDVWKYSGTYNSKQNCSQHTRCN
ncbi:MAG: hypothetical protein LBU42_01025, partial [Prevotellaceae bacterium]|nr:hypothetical protein [Prevotellaceae bacterium]